MTVKTDQQIEFTLEEFIDQCGLQGVLAMLANVTREKAEHIRCNWQDRALAAMWDEAARAIDHASVAAEKRGL